jgi:hypothetical protein
MLFFTESGVAMTFASRSTPAVGQAAPQRSLAPMGVVFLVALAPIVAAVVLYFTPQWWPSQQQHYATLIQPQRNLPEAQALALRTLDNQPFDLRSLQNRWLMVVVDRGDCGDDCARKLFITRNVHASQGKNVDRVARVWLITDDQPVPQRVLDAYQGTLMLRVDPAQAAAFLLGDAAASADLPKTLRALGGPIWVIDPLGHLVLRFPENADPVKVRDDLRLLLRNSRIG